MVKQAWKEWIFTNSNRLASLDSEDFTDLAFLRQYLENKSIVQMGEVAHGIAEQNRLRVRLIKYLHQEFCFNVVAFESGFFDCYMTNQDIRHMGSLEVLRNSIHSFWHTADLLDLFNYMKKSYSTASPLLLAGFDVQSLGRKITSRPLFFKDIISKIDTEFANTIFKIDSILVHKNYYAQLDYVENNYHYLCEIYDQLVSMLSDKKDMLRQYYEDSYLNTAREFAKSAREYIAFRAGDSNLPHNTRTFKRDKQMADTFRYMKEQLYPNSKIIVWSHNCHIIKDPVAVDLVHYSPTMGFWLDQEYHNQLYTIISLAYRGRINYGQVQNLVFKRDNCIEAILYNARKNYFFLDTSQQIQNEGNSWIFQPVYQSYIHRDAGMYDIIYIPREQFDGILFIDTVSQPEYLY